jgi:broad specificity phosphatase PhoE
MELYIIRHAQSVNNALVDQRQRVCDPPLTELGHRQADVLADHLACGHDSHDLASLRSVFRSVDPRTEPGYGITRLFCSPMIRSLQTARPVSRALGLTPEVWVDIHEHGGIFLEEEGVFRGYPGQSRAEILADFPEYVLPEGIGERGWWTGSREEEAARESRAISVAVQLHKWAALPDRIAIISHGGFIDGLLKTLLNQSRSYMLYYHKYNVSVSRLHFREDGLRVDYLNRIDHMPAEMITP